MAERSKTFQIIAHYLSSSENSTSTLADIEIKFDGTDLLNVFDLETKTRRTSIRVDAWNLAVWFAANRSDLLQESSTDGMTLDWKMSHCLGAVGGGFAWPDITFVREKDVMCVCAKPSKDGLIEHLSEVCLIMSVNEFVKGMDEFVESVLTRIDVVDVY